jgi:hypothetical protein
MPDGDTEMWLLCLREGCENRDTGPRRAGVTELGTDRRARNSGTAVGRFGEDSGTAVFRRLREKRMSPAIDQTRPGLILAMIRLW